MIMWIKQQMYGKALLALESGVHLLWWLLITFVLGELINVEKNRKDMFYNSLQHTAQQSVKKKSVLSYHIVTYWFTVITFYCFYIVILTLCSSSLLNWCSLSLAAVRACWRASSRRDISSPYPDSFSGT